MTFLIAAARIRYPSWLDRADISGPANLTAPEPVTNEEFVRVLARVLGRPALLAVPPLALRAIQATTSPDRVGATRAR